MNIVHASSTYVKVSAYIGLHSFKCFTLNDWMVIGFKYLLFLNGNKNCVQRMLHAQNGLKKNLAYFEQMSKR